MSQMNPLTANHKIQEKISGRLHDFDIISLLRLLFYLGYSPEDITFKSYNSLCSQAGLIRKIRFVTHPSSSVVITLDMGLLSAQSPLPSYFQKNIERSLIDVKAFYEFIGCFDHLLMSEFFKCVYPELNLNPVFEVDALKSTMIRMLDLRSCTTLDWIYRLVFPELEVCIEKAAVLRQVSMVPLTLGRAILGENAVFGDQTKIMVSGRRVTLYASEELTDTGDPWPREIKNRLRLQVFPILRTIGLDIEVSLVIMSQKQWAKLHQETYLGYDKIRGGSDQYKQIRIFRGYLSSS